MNKIKEHFEAIAGDYDYYKKKSWYYYENLKKLYRELIPENSAVLEIGCGTGDLLASISPSIGVGIDVSKRMIELAKKKHLNNKSIVFLTGTAGNLKNDLSSKHFRYIFMSDVIEHLENVAEVIGDMFQIAKPKTKLIISMANPIWEPVLLLLEKLKMKMPEGPHHRIWGSELEKILKERGFLIGHSGYRQLIPAKIPLISNFVNANFYRIPLIKSLGLTQFWVCSKN
jgi:ubiquinone/menaquinone biosynthesis C-methylase UbiE